MAYGMQNVFTYFHVDTEKVMFSFILFIFSFFFKMNNLTTTHLRRVIQLGVNLCMRFPHQFTL